MSLIEVYREIDNEFLTNSPYSECHRFIEWIISQPVITAILIYNIIESVRVIHPEKLKAWDTSMSGISDRVMGELMHGMGNTPILQNPLDITHYPSGMPNINAKILYRIASMDNDFLRYKFIEHIKTFPSIVCISKHGDIIDEVNTNNKLSAINSRIMEIVKSYPYNRVEDGLFIYIGKHLSKSTEYNAISDLGGITIIDDTEYITDIDIMMDMYEFYVELNWRYIPDIQVSCIVLEDDKVYTGVIQRMFPDTAIVVHGGCYHNVPDIHKCGLLNVLCTRGMPSIILCPIYDKKTVLKFNLLCDHSVGNERNVVLVSYNFIKEHLTKG